ncbi:MAG: hypothetical protein ACEQSA_05925 [Weeksellaceae bacterium]
MVKPSGKMVKSYEGKTPEEVALIKNKAALLRKAIGNATIVEQQKEEAQEEVYVEAVERREARLDQMLDYQYRQEQQYQYAIDQQQFAPVEVPKKRGPGRPKKSVETLEYANPALEDYITRYLYRCYLKPDDRRPAVLYLSELNERSAALKHQMSIFLYEFLKSMCSRAIPGDNYLHLALKDLYFIGKYDVLENGTVFPLTETRFNEVITSYMLMTKIICFDSNHKIYFWVGMRYLFTLIDKPEYLLVFLSEMVQFIGMQLSIIDNTLRKIFSMPQVGRGGHDFYANYLTHLHQNLTSFRTLTKSITQTMMKNIYTSLLTSGQIRCQDNTIEYLNEKGRPKYLPMKDNYVYNLTSKQFEVRQPYHAFLTSCDMLSTQFTMAELKWALDNYDVNAKNLFKDIISSICNDDPLLIKKIKFILGCCLSGTPAKALIIIYSRHTNSGKTILSKIVFILLGNKAEAFDNGLVIDNGKSTHETNKACLTGLWAACVDELPQDYTFSKDIQLYTSGAKNKIGARRAHMSYKELSLLLANILVFTNYPSDESFRCVVVTLPCGFCSNPENGPYPKSWVISKDANGDSVLLEELRKPGVIRKQIHDLENQLEYNHYEKLMMLVEVIKAAEERIETPDMASEQLISDTVVRSGLPVTIESFLAVSPDDEYVVQNTKVRLNPYLDVADNRTNKKSLATISQYYESYRQFVKQRFDCRPSSKVVVTRVLNDLGFIEDKDRTRFVHYNDHSVRKQMGITGIINLFYQPLLDTAAISDGINKKDVHEKIFNYIVDFNKRIERKEIQEEGLYYEPTISFIKDYIERIHPEYIKGKDGKSGNHNYYHLRTIDSIFNSI